jgi:peroxiredoxin
MKYHLPAFVAIVVIALTTPLIAADGAAAKPAAAVPAAIPGLKVGERAPAFTLKSATGQEVTLSALLTQGKVALAFVRSADWCPFCRKQLQELQQNLAAIEAAGVKVVALSYDSAATNAAAVAKLGLTFPLLADEGSKAIDAYGIRNAEAKGRSAGVPHPVLYLLDQQGTIRAKLARDHYRDRPESAEIIAAAKNLR